MWIMIISEDWDPSEQTINALMFQASPAAASMESTHREEHCHCLGPSALYDYLG